MSHELDLVLDEIAAELVWPVDSVSVESSVLERLRIARPIRARHSTRLAYALIALLVVSIIIYLTPPARQAVANIFGAAGIHITIGGGPVDQAAVDLGLGTAISIDDLPGAMDFEPLIPAGSRLGPPDGVFVGGGGAEVNMAWEAKLEIPAAGGTGIGVLLTQSDVGLNGLEGVKTVPQASLVEAVLVDGVQGFWIEGAHTIVWVDDAGRELDETRRLAANVLLWSKDGVNLRLETTADLATALDLAESLG